MRSRRRARRAACGLPVDRWSLLSGVLVAVVVLAGCSLGGPPRPQGGAPTTLGAPTGAPDAQEQAAQPANARFYDQEPAWTGCGSDGLQCATVTVPVDWSAPPGATLAIALDRYPARDADHREGSLLLNPGGPGASGADFLREAGRGAVSDHVADRYDLVGFDPRGVGASDPVDCVSDAQWDTYLSQDADGDTAAGLAQRTAVDVQFAQGCAAHAGQLLAHISTADAARDMDVIRAALRQRHLDYLGYSYGTLLGATYAGTFPQRVGRFVLDGALTPTVTSSELALEQAEGLERALRTYVSGCAQRQGCTLSRKPATAVAQVRTLLARAGTTPLATGTARPLNGALAASGVIQAMYSEQLWPDLDDALGRALRGDGGGLLQLADAYSQRQPDGSYPTNYLQAFTAITCADYPVDASVEAMRAEAARLEATSPTFGSSLSYGALQCGVWPVPATRTPAPITAAGAAPILVVGNTGDPITPYPWARELASQLDSGRLLTWHGQGHASYRRGSACVDAAVDGYLVDGVLPGRGATCAT